MTDRVFFSLAFGALLLVWGCSLIGGGTEVKLVRIDSIEVLSHAERSVRFAVTGRWRNTCGDVSRFESSRDGRVYLVRMYGEQPKGALCGQAITPISGEWGTEVPAPGTYTFQFWQGDGASLDTVLTFE